MPDLRVLVVASDPLARAALAQALAEDEDDDCEVVGQESSDADLLAAQDLYRPDVLLWDMGWDADSAAAGRAVEYLSDLSDDLPPIVALLPGGEGAGDLAVQVWTAGARGLLLRAAPAVTLVAALQAAAAGLIAVDPAFAPAIQPAAPGREPSTLPEELTSRELEVLRLLAEGLANKAIARQLGISEHTVKFHVNALLGKLDAQSRTEAVVRATRLGLILL